MNRKLLIFSLKVLYQNIKLSKSIICIKSFVFPRKKVKIPGSKRTFYWNVSLKLFLLIYRQNEQEHFRIKTELIFLWKDDMLYLILSYTCSVNKTMIPGMRVWHIEYALALLKGIMINTYFSHFDWLIDSLC